MADFTTAVAITMDNAHEGGFQNKADDKGNWTGGAVGVGELKGTKYGISAREFPLLDIENLTTEQAATIYQEKYWNPLYTQIKDQLVANKLFDLGILFGVGTAVEIVQTILSKSGWPLVIDERFGSATLDMINKSEPVSLLLAYKTAFVTHVLQIAAANPAMRPFVKDWIRRINS